MKIYPAIRAQMGNWNYFIVRMKMREIAHEVDLAHDIYQDKTLSDAIQRTLGENRVKKDIVGYLVRREDRFFSSIVVAAMDGKPAWTPLSRIDPSAVPESLAKSLGETFGILSFCDEPKYYALDGQHRVHAVKLLVNGNTRENPPAGFDEDFLSVIVVLREDHDVSEREWLRRYRRLFSSLNRYAKPTDRDTNIIMDEDDLFAILTRRLITDHDFFRAPGREKESFKVLTKGKNLKSNDSHFTALQTLYAMNETLLTTRERINRGWFSDGGSMDKQIRPEEDFIDDAYAELSAYWDAILETLPDLKRNPLLMRCHDREDYKGLAPYQRIESVGVHLICHAEEGWEGDLHDHLHDHLVFWPIGQELFAKLVRALLDDGFPQGGRADVERMKSALEPLSRVSWELHDAPWRHLLLVSRGDHWRMRSEDRKSAAQVAENILRWMLNLDSLDEEQTTELRKKWQELLLHHDGPADGEYLDEMWQEAVNMRARVMAGG